MGKENSDPTIGKPGLEESLDAKTFVHITREWTLRWETLFSFAEAVS